MMHMIITPYSTAGEPLNEISSGRKLVWAWRLSNLEPGVLHDVSNSDALVWVSCQRALQKMSAFWRNMLGLLKIG